MRGLLIALLVSVNFFACKSKKSTVATSSSVIINPKFIPTVPVKPFHTIKEARIEGDELIIQVEYGGGCEEHNFELVFTGNYLKSLPMKAELYLSHENHNDACKKLISEELLFNIEELGGTSKELVLLLDGWKEPIVYQKMK